MLEVLGKFLRDRSGNYGMMIAILTFPVLTLTVKAADFALASKLKGDLQALADSVALTSVKQLEQSDAAARAAGQAVYDTGLLTLGEAIVGDTLQLDLSVTPELRSHVEITVTYSGIFGSNWTLTTQEVTVEADAAIPIQELELAVATDLSPSMDATEIAALIKSMRQLSAEVYAFSSDFPVRMAYAPFTRNVSLPSYASAWISGTGTSTPGRICVGPRSTSIDATDTTPTAAIFPAFKESATYCPPEVLQPLTSAKADIDALVNKVEAHTGPYRGTGVYEGLAWTYRALSPKWKGFWPTGSTPLAYGKARKVALIMTDGFNDASVGYTKTVADQITLDACKNMKADGIEVFFITYKVTADLVDLYSECASSASHFIDSPSDQDLANAFSALTKRLSAKGPVLTN